MTPWTNSSCVLYWCFIFRQHLSISRKDDSNVCRPDVREYQYFSH